jgi:UDP-2,4-diacetamido-2,4,6-trideoxy-beta-L-altropyranose hydrolase
VRASAFSSEAISWDEHVVWFRDKLADRNCRIFVALDASGRPAGQIRIDRAEGSGADVAIAIDIAIDARFRGLGYGSRLIEMGSDKAFAEWGTVQLNAFVKPENAASAKAFERAGFKATAKVTVKGQTAIHYIRTAK